MPINVIKGGDASSVSPYELSSTALSNPEGLLKDPMAVERDAYQKGFESGEKAGLQTAQRKMVLQEERLENIIRDIADAKECVIKNAAGEVVSIAFAVAGRILRREVVLSEDAFLPVLKDAMREVFDSERVVIKLNQQDLEFIKKRPGLAGELKEGRKTVAFEADEGIEHGGCIVVTEHKEVEATLQAQLEELYKSVAEQGYDDGRP